MLLGKLELLPWGFSSCKEKNLETDVEQTGDKFLRAAEKNDRVGTCQENGKGKEEVKKSCHVT